MQKEKIQIPSLEPQNTQMSEDHTKSQDWKKRKG